MCTLVRPKDANETRELVKAAKIECLWGFVLNHGDTDQVYFDYFSPILLVYNKNKLIGFATNKFGKLEIFAPDDANITNKFEPNILDEIKNEL